MPQHPRYAEVLLTLSIPFSFLTTYLVAVFWSTQSDIKMAMQEQVRGNTRRSLGLAALIFFPLEVADSVMRGYYVHSFYVLPVSISCYIVFNLVIAWKFQRSGLKVLSLLDDKQLDRDLSSHAAKRIGEMGYWIKMCSYSMTIFALSLGMLISPLTWNPWGRFVIWVVGFTSMLSTSCADAPPTAAPRTFLAHWPRSAARRADTTKSGPSVLRRRNA